MMKKNCDNCFFEHLSIRSEPCNHCGDDGVDSSKWQPGLVDSCERDPVNHPEHYTRGGIECIDAIRAALTAEEWRGYCKGNAIKYIWRERYKGGNESISKADWYLDKMIDAEVPHD